jgi:hypothetical protein
VRDEVAVWREAAKFIDPIFLGLYKQKAREALAAVRGEQKEEAK